MYDLGDPVPLGVEVRNSAGALANATAVTLTVTLPDGTTATPTVSNPSTGSYTATYTPAAAGRFTARWVATGTNACAYTTEFTVDDPALLSLVSLAEFKTHLNITATTSDDELRDTLTAATAAAEGWCNRALTRRSVTETYDGGTHALRLRTPVALSVTTVTENSVTVASTGWQLDSGVVLRRLSGTSPSTWTAGVGVVSVTYATGVQGRDLDIARRGVLGIGKHLWDTQRGAMRIGPRDDDQWVPGMGFAIPNRASQLLALIALPGAA